MSVSVEVTIINNDNVLVELQPPPLLEVEIAPPPIIEVEILTPPPLEIDVYPLPDQAIVVGENSIEVEINPPPVFEVEIYPYVKLTSTEWATVHW